MSSVPNGLGTDSLFGSFDTNPYEDAIPTEATDYWLCFVSLISSRTSKLQSEG